MESNKKYVSPQEWNIAYGDYLSQADDYEVQHKKLLKRDKVYKYTFYSLIGTVCIAGYLIILRMLSRM